MFTCRDVSDKASDYLEGPTTFMQRLHFQLHLIICVHCRRYFRQLRLTSAVAGQISELTEPSDEEIESLVRRLQDTI